MNHQDMLVDTLPVFTEPTQSPTLHWHLYAAAALRTDSERGIDARVQHACKVADQMVLEENERRREARDEEDK